MVKVKNHRVWKWYDSVLYSLMLFKYNKKKSSGSYNRRVWVDILIIWYTIKEQMNRMSVSLVQCQRAESVPSAATGTAA